MRELKASTYKGKQIIEKGSHYDGYILSQVYDKYSVDKENAYDWCYNEYLETENHEAFSICSHNNFGFTCSWVGTIDGRPIMRYETKDNSYLIWLDC